MKKIKHIGFAIMLLLMSACGNSYDQTVEIETLGNQMKFNVVTIKAEPNTKILLKFTNNATMPIMKHNIIVLNDENAIDEVGKAAINAIDNRPNHPSIIAASNLIGPGEYTELEVNIPDKKGVYPYICTFPGHYQVMQGKIIVK